MREEKNRTVLLTLLTYSYNETVAAKINSTEWNSMTFLCSMHTTWSTAIIKHETFEAIMGNFINKNLVKIEDSCVHTAQSFIFLVLFKSWSQFFKHVEIHINVISKVLKSINREFYQIWLALSVTVVLSVNGSYDKPYTLQHLPLGEIKWAVQSILTTQI